MRRRHERGPESLTRGLLRCGVVAGPLFVTTFLVEGATRADYNALRHPVSGLALGPGGWVQTANFAVTGALYLASAAGLSRSAEPATGTRVGPILIAAAAVGLLGSATFITDPVSGYPPGTPGMPTGYSTCGALHDLFAVPTFLGLPAAATAYARVSHRNGNRGWTVYSLATAVVMLASVGLASAAFNPLPTLVRLGGLFQRVSVATGFAWLTALSARALRDRASRGMLDATPEPMPH